MNMNIDLLLYLAETDRRCLINCVCTDLFRSWAGLDYNEYLSGVRRLMEISGNEVRKLLKIRFLAEHLVYQNNKTNLMTELFLQIPDIADWVPDNVGNHFNSGAWRFVTVPLILEKRVTSRHFVTGCIPDTGPRIHLWPEWAEPLMDNACKFAIKMAATAASGHTNCPDKVCFFCFPLAVPNYKLQFEGSSLGLSLALGFLSAAAGSPIPDNIFATGRIDGNGHKVLPIGHFRQKAGAVMKKDGLLIHPASNFLPEGIGSQNLLPVKTFSHAWMFTQLYRKENNHQLTLFSAMLDDPDIFVNQIRSVPANWLNWAKNHKAIISVIDNIKKNPRLFARLTTLFTRLVREGKTDVAEILYNLVDETSDKTFFLNDCQISSLSAFRWCGASLLLNNHKGKTETAETWIAYGNRLIPEAKKADLESVVDFFNNMLVARHNRYSFSPYLPPELQEILKLLEKQYQIQCDYGCLTNLVLGRLYGTITQNYAFCGPRFLERTRRFSLMARRALGENSVPEFEPEWRRQFNYLTFACLDAGLAEEAEKNLLNYLRADSPDHLLTRLKIFNPWEHFLLCRYIADMKRNDLAPKYIQGAKVKGFVNIIPQHPWQLWHYNMGRLAVLTDDRKNAEKYFRKSVELCTSGISGYTVTVMALLPLAGLLSINRLSKNDMSIIDETVIPAAGHLNPAYFNRVINSKNHFQLLDSILENSSTFFPFSYR